MNYDAYRKRLNRAKKSAEKTLKETGFLAFEIEDIEYPASLIAIDPETSRAKIVRVCLNETETSKLGKIRNRGNIKLEIWYRQPKEKDFEIIKV